MKIAVIVDGEGLHNFMDVLLLGHDVKFFKTSKDFRTANLNLFDAIIVFFNLSLNSVNGIKIIKAINKKTEADIAIVFDSMGIEVSALSKVKVSKVFHTKNIKDGLPIWLEYIKGKKNIYDGSKKAKDFLMLAGQTVGTIYAL